MSYFFCFFTVKFLSVIFQRNDFSVGKVSVHMLNFTDFDPSNYLHQLTDIEIERFFTFTNNQRKQEFVATRILRHQLFGLNHIYYDAIGAPYIKDDGYISISHTKNCVGIAFSKDFKIGLDIEFVRTKISAIKHKFLSVNELEKFDCDSLVELTKIWSAKESLYKVSGKNGINFRTQLELEKIANDKWRGKIINDDTILSADLKIIEFEDKIISVNITNCEKTEHSL